MDRAHRVLGMISQKTVIDVLHERMHALGDAISKTVRDLGLLGGPVTCVPTSMTTMDVFRTVIEQYVLHMC